MDEQNEKGVVFTRKLLVSNEDMERINTAVEKWREQGLPEHEIKKYRDGLVKRNGKWVENENESSN